MREYDKYDNIFNVLKGTEYLLDDYKFILNKLEDEKSKLALYYRVMLDNTQDSFYGLNLVRSSYYNESFNDSNDKQMFNCINFLLKNNNYKKNMYFIGFSENETIPRNLVWHSQKPANVECIFDDITLEEEYMYDCAGKMINVFSFDRVEQYQFKKDSIFIISDGKYAHFKKYLIEHLGININNIFVFTENIVWQRNYQYFGETFVKIDDEEIFVDAGSYDLLTTYEFFKWSLGNYKKMYLFEPLKELYDATKDNVANDSNIEFYNIGLWNKKDIVGFSIDDSASRIQDNADNNINVDSLDNVLDGREVTIIKMDIEGAEYEAINGSVNTIQKYSPVLMISVYHKPNDIIKLIKQVLQIKNDYKVFIRHYAYTCYETVAYFVPETKINKF